MLLEPIYEGEFHNFSFGFRPGKSSHQALEDLYAQCYEQDVAYVLDVDLRKYFDTIDHKHLREILHPRVGAGVITRMINKWLKAGVWEAGTVQYPEAGSPQGGVIRPLISNVYLHTVLDDWYVNDIQPHLEGKSFMVRYADDFVIGFANKSDAESMLEVLKERFAAYTGCKSIQRKRDWCNSNVRANTRTNGKLNPRPSTSSALRITGANRSKATGGAAEDLRETLPPLAQINQRVGLEASPSVLEPKFRSRKSEDRSQTLTVISSLAILAKRDLP